ncbi:MAG: hypothetical protein H7843_03745 [Nitrospirota bacterium]|uniref:Secreted protein n=1 Tax=Candidatus Magnetominusculus xianensis TaxID=1748249 RepID=A0ABR5SJ34_9BACT|nr:hypothetical protein [Candidatus Magnetominusculus xianensis]KWT93553.1 hypothetical protein ASN18_0303 [Candidatus Magnetominusculus xianensis]MBF0405679.1 hypothetical protein [Nitrospirota bacterium]
MKKLMTLLVAALFALSMTSAVFAEDKPAAPAPDAKKDMKDAKKDAKDAKKEEKKEEKK